MSRIRFGKTGIRIGVVVLLGSVLPLFGWAQRGGFAPYNPPRVPMPERATPRDSRLPPITVFMGTSALPQIWADTANISESELMARVDAAAAADYEDRVLRSGERVRLRKSSVGRSTRIVFYYDPFRPTPENLPPLASLRKDGRVVGVTVNQAEPLDAHAATHPGALDNPKTLWTWKVPAAERGGNLDLPENVDGWADTGCQYTLGTERFVPVHIRLGTDAQPEQAERVFLFDAQKGLRWERDLSPFLKNHAQSLIVHGVATLPDGSVTVVTAAARHRAADTGCRLIVLGANGQVLSLTDILGVYSTAPRPTRSGKHFVCELGSQTALLDAHGAPLGIFTDTTGTPYTDLLHRLTLLSDDREAVAPAAGLVWNLTNPAAFHPPAPREEQR